MLNKIIIHNSILKLVLAMQQSVQLTSCICMAAALGIPLAFVHMFIPEPLQVLLVEIAVMCAEATALNYTCKSYCKIA